MRPGQTAREALEVEALVSLDLVDQSRRAGLQDDDRVELLDDEASAIPHRAGGFDDGLEGRDRVLQLERLLDRLHPMATKPTLVLGGTGKTGRRVVERLDARGLPTRVGSRSGRPPFDWEDRSTWEPALDGVGSVYVSHYLDAMPGAAETVGSLADLAFKSGARRLVLLSGRGEAEAERVEQAVRDTGADLTILRSTWFAQNFSENYFVDGLLVGELALPAGTRRSPSWTPTTSRTWQWRR